MINGGNAYGTEQTWSTSQGNCINGTIIALVAVAMRRNTDNVRYARRNLQFLYSI